MTQRWGAGDAGVPVEGEELADARDVKGGGEVQKLMLRADRMLAGARVLAGADHGVAGAGCRR
jgi:hypothetical protein